MMVAQMTNAVTASTPKPATRAYTASAVANTPQTHAAGAGRSDARAARKSRKPLDRTMKTNTIIAASASGRLTAPLSQNNAPSGSPSAGVAASGDTPRRAGSTLECAAAAVDDIVLVRLEADPER